VLDINDGGIVPPPSGGDADALLTTIQQLCRARSQEEVMAIVSHGVRSLLQADGATFVLRDGDRCYYAEEDAISPLWKGRRFPMNACISGWCMMNHKPVAVPDIYQDARVPADAYRPTFVRSLAMAPVGERDSIAALGAYWSEKRETTPEELARLQAIADAASLAIANVQLRQAGAPERPKPTPVRKAPKPRENSPPVRRSPQAFLDRVRREGLRANSLEAYGFAVFCVVVATVIREVVRATELHGLVIYSTYYPAAVLAMVVGGRRAGLLALILGGFTAYWFFMTPMYELAPLTAKDFVNLSLYVGSCTLILLIIDWYQRNLLRLRQEDARHLTLAREQHHRVKNAVTVVEAIVHQSLRDQPDRSRTINQRIRAGLAKVDLQVRDGAPTTLRDALATELQPYDLARFTLEGEGDRLLPPYAGSLVALAAHELATNAVKYGALSLPAGHVTVTWRTVEGRAVIRWREAGGPPVLPPQKRGYGSIMLRRLVEAAGGSMTMEFQPTGLIADISLTLDAARRH
jgi:two-component sensor histidine kinase